MMTPQMKSILEMNKVTNRNLQQLAKQHAEYGQEGQVTSADIKRNIQLVTTSKEVIDEYREELYQHLWLYINDDDIVNRLTQSELSDDVVRELAINWNSKYAALVDTMAGKNVTLNKFVDFLRDIVAESVNAKTKKSSSTNEKESTSTNNVDPKMEDIYPDTSNFESEPINAEDEPVDAEVVVIPQVETDIATIRSTYFNSNANNTASLEGKELKEAFDISFKKMTETSSLANAKLVLFAKSTEQNALIHQRLVQYFSVYLNVFNRAELLSYYTKLFDGTPKDNVAKYTKIVDVFNVSYNDMYDKMISSANYDKSKDVIEKQKYEITTKQCVPKPFGKVPTSENIMTKIGNCSNLVLAMILYWLSYQPIDITEVKTKTKVKKEGDDEPVVKGKGLKSYHKPMHKYYVDKNKLNDGILEIRYQANGHLSNLKPTTISPQLAVVLRQMMMSGDIDLKDFALLSPEEQVLTKKLVRMFQLDIYLVDDTHLIKKQFELLQGERDAGNNSKALEGKISDYQNLMNSK